MSSNARQLTDESVFQITQILYSEFRDELNQKKLDEQNIDEFKQKFIKPLYPHKLSSDKQGNSKIEKYNCDEYCCELDAGRFLCCNTSPPDDQYRDFGLGVCLYVKFLKHLACFLCFMSIFAAVAVGLYYVVSINLDYNIVGGYENFIFAGTTGIMASQFSKCEYDVIDTSSMSGNFQVSCPVGRINYYGVVFSNETLKSLENCRSEIDKVNSQKYIPSNLAITQTCQEDKSKCKVNYSFTTNVYDQFQYEYVAYTFECSDSIFTLGNSRMNSATVTYIVFGIDFALVLFFLMFLCSENSAQSKQQFYFKNKQLAINDFTVKIEGFTLSNVENQLDYFIKGFHDEQQQYVDHLNLLQNIVQIKIPETQQVRQAIERRRDAYQTLYDLIDECFFEEMIDVNNYRDAKDFIYKLYGHAETPEYIQYKRVLTEGVHQFLASKKIRQGTQREQFQSPIPVSVFMVLSNPKFKRSIFRKAKKQCFKKKLTVLGRQHYISEPPVADMINWQNLHKFTCCRVLLVWLITILICLCSYLLVGVSQFKKNQLVSNNSFGEDCQVLYSDSQLETYDESIANLQESYFSCYCDYNKFDTDILRGECYDWAIDYGVYLSIPVLISLGIVLYNLIISRIFRVLTKFQGHSDITSQLYSYIIKRAFVLIMNMGLIMILLKLDYDPQDNKLENTKDFYFLFQGTYTDITADWYLEIGVIITLTLSFNIFIPFLEMLFLSFLKCIRKCWDRRCYTRRTSQKTKKAYLELYTNDVFPIEERYADLVAIMIITLAFSGVMPGLYIIAFFSLLFMMLSDKLLLFRVYQKPINYTSNLQCKVFKTLYIGLMIHCAVSIFLFSQPHLVAAGTIYNVDLLQVSNKRLNPIIQEPYLIAYVCLLLLLMLFGLLNSTLFSLFGYCREKCKKGLSKMNKRKLNQNFYESLNQYQINRVKMSMEKQLNKNVSHTFSKIRKDLKKDKKTHKMVMQETQVQINEDRKHMSELIAQNTLSKLNEIEEKRRQERRKQGGKANEKIKKAGMAKLIGRAGYEQMFDDQIFYRERKIKSLDCHLGDIMGKNFQTQKNRPPSPRSKVMEITHLDL